MPIDIVLPVSKSDENRLQPFLMALRAFGPYHTTNILIVPTAEMMERGDIRNWMNEVSSLFNNATIKPLPNTPTGGWPKAPNEHFMWGCIYQSETLRNFWLWLELDCTPLKAGWLEELEHEHRLGGKSYMGFIGQSHEGRKYPNGEIKHVPLEPHMEGVAIYPPNHKDYCILATKPSTQIPFDIYCRFYTTQRGGNWLCTGSKKMMHRWKTTNYRMENGVILCSDAEPPASPELTSAGPVDLVGKVLHHGDKGSSLAEMVVAAGGIDNLLRGKRNVTPVQIPVATETKPKLAELITGVFYDPAIDPQKALEPVIEAWGYSKFPPTLEVSDPGLGVNTDQPSDTPATSGASEGAEDASEVIHTQPAPVSGGAQNLPSIEAVEEVLAGSEKKLRLGEVMSALGITQDQKGAFLKFLVDEGYRAAAPAYWVQKAA